MLLNKKYFSLLKEDAKSRLDTYLQLDEIRLEYKDIDLKHLKPDIDYVGVNYKEVKDDIDVSFLSVTLDISYKDSDIPCGYYKSFYNFNEFKNELECIDEVFSLFIDEFQFQ